MEDAIYRALGEPFAIDDEDYEYEEDQDNEAEDYHYTGGGQSKRLCSRKKALYSLARLSISLALSTVTAVLLVPVDSVLNTVNAYPEKYEGFFDCARSMWELGGWRAFYHSFLPNLLCYHLCLETVKEIGCLYSKN